MRLIRSPSTADAVNAGALFSSRTTTWETPPDFFARLDREFHFTLDVCATRKSRKCERFFSAEQNALKRRWKGTCWMNPPYGKTIGLWLKMALTQSRLGATVVSLIPARTDTAWWQDVVMRAAEIRLVRGRLRFVGASAPAPFPSAVAIFRPGASARRPRVVAWDWRATEPL